MGEGPDPSVRHPIGADLVLALGAKNLGVVEVLPGGCLL